MTGMGDSARTEPAVVNSSSALAEANSYMEWEASQYRWDATTMKAEKSATYAPAAAEETSGRRSARSAAVASAAALAAGAARASSTKRSTGELACQVPGCGVSLAAAKEYHQRYRICLAHAKVGSVELDGVTSRFCQQCGKFHEVAQFDGTRHSCRQQLQRHNALRRRAAPSSREHTSITAAAAPTVRPADRPGCGGRPAKHRSSAPWGSGEEPGAAAADPAPSYSCAPAAPNPVPPGRCMGLQGLHAGDAAAMAAALAAGRQQQQHPRGVEYSA
ncbi:SBP domain-containing protein [Scenedesmus sp. NREL 46B-D3]|nr:SBP domain-containing protein [Scenedesmus sp. NREL 46B-D3]